MIKILTITKGKIPTHKRVWITDGITKTILISEIDTPTPIIRQILTQCTIDKNGTVRTN